MKKSSLPLILFLLMFFSLISSPLEALEVRVSNDTPIQGELVIIEVESIEAPTGLFSHKELVFREHQGAWLALFGISYWLDPGEYVLRVEGERVYERVLKVFSGEFKESWITVSEEVAELVDPMPEDETIIKRREEDRRRIAQAYSQSLEENLWSGPFIWPAEGRITSGFGETRYVNQRLAGRHSGIDIGAPLGTIITAANCGQVRLAEDLLVTGLTIIIDHGWGIFSSYSHLSALKVEEGQLVKKGETIGLMGSTGFSTGSHLHWVIRTSATYLNPEQFLRVDILDSIHSTEEVRRDPLYLVRIGKYSTFSEALYQRDALIDSGFEGFIVEDKMYSIQVGAFTLEENARNLLSLLESRGYTPFIIEDRE